MNIYSNSLNMLQQFSGQKNSLIQETELLESHLQEVEDQVSKMKLKYSYLISESQTSIFQHVHNIYIICKFYYQTNEITC